jgi:hypothetical protein
MGRFAERRQQFSRSPLPSVVRDVPEKPSKVGVAETPNLRQGSLWNFVFGPATAVLVLLELFPFTIRQALHECRCCGLEISDTFVHGRDYFLDGRSQLFIRLILCLVHRLAPNPPPLF